MIVDLFFIQSVLNWSRQVFLLIVFFMSKIRRNGRKVPAEIWHKKLYFAKIDMTQKGEAETIMNISSNRCLEEHTQIHEYGMEWMECPCPGEEEGISLGK